MLFPHCMETAMKLIILTAILMTLTGCAIQPQSPADREYRLRVMQTMMSNRYILPAPQPMYVPQTRTANCITSGAYTNCTVQ